MNIDILLKAMDEFICKVSALPEWKEYHKAADSYISSLMALFMLARDNLADSINLGTLASVIAAGGGVKDIEDSIDWNIFDSTFGDAEAIIINAMAAGGKVSARGFRNTLSKGYFNSNSLDLSFNMRNPQAIAWASRHSGELVRQVSNETKEAIRLLTTRAFQFGGHPYETARQIRNYIGLTANQIKSVLNYQGRLDAAGYTKSQADKMIDAYVRKKIRERAETIARTETIKAAHTGQQLHWDDMLTRGFIDKEEVEKEWIVTPDDRLCSICQAMSGQKVPVDGMFDFGGSGPPRHPNCRCSMKLTEKENVTAKPRTKPAAKPKQAPAVPALPIPNAKPAKPKFIPALTLQEAQNWAVNSLGVPSVDYTGMDLVLANNINKSLQDMFIMFPKMKGQIDFIKCENMSAFARYSRVATTMPDGSIKIETGLEFDKTVYGSKSNLYSHINKAVASNLHYAGITEKEIVYHEFTHAVDFKLICDKLNIDVNNVTPSQWQAIVYDSKIRPIIATDVFNEACNSIGKKYTDAEVIQELGRYAKHNDKELIAQGASNALSSKPGKLGKAILKEIKRRMK